MVKTVAPIIHRLRDGAVIGHPLVSDDINGGGDRALRAPRRVAEVRPLPATHRAENS
jgi:hypothetical protein